MLDEREKTSVTDPLGRATCTTVCATSVSVLGAWSTITVPEFWKDDSCLNCWNRAVLRLYLLCCMPTMIVQDSMTVVFPKVEVPTITCVGFLKTMLDEREMACVTDFRSSVVSILSWCTTDHRLCRNFWKDYNCQDCRNRSILCLHPFHWSRHLNLCMNRSRRYLEGCSSYLSS